MKRAGNWIILILVILGIAFGILNQAVYAFETKVDEISKYLSDEIAKTDKKIVAVVDFTDLQGNVTELGRFFAQEISTSIAMAGQGFEVVDRTHLNSILAEHKLAEKGVIDPNTARQLGKIAGVELLITGTITPLGDNIRLNAMVLDTETAKIIAGAKENLPMTGTLASLSGSEIKNVSSKNVRSSSGSKERAEKEEFEYFGFTIKPLSCEKKGTELVCPVTFTNLESEQRQVIVSKVTFYDELGNVYQNRNTGVLVGQRKGRVGNYINHKFLPQLPAKVEFIVMDFKSSASAVTVSIDIQEAESKTSSTYMIKDIPIIK